LIYTVYSPSGKFLWNTKTADFYEASLKKNVFRIDMPVVSVVVLIVR
jgi:hypothetical protein